MDCVLQEEDIVDVEKNGKFLVVKTIVFNGECYHYMVKIKEDQGNPEVIFAKEDILSNEELDLLPITDKALIEKLLQKI